MNLNEDIPAALASACAKRLAAMGVDATTVRLVRYCDNLVELHSFLRDRVFRDDAKVNAFVRQCVQDTQPPPQETVPFNQNIGGKMVKTEIPFYRAESAVQHILQELDLGFEEPPEEPAKPNRWAGRMNWKPQANPRLHPDEEAALGADQPERSTPLRGTANPKHGMRFHWRPPEEPVAPGEVQRPRGGPVNLEPMTSSADLQRIIQALRAEEAKPPHQRNEAAIARLRAEANELLSTEESLWVQRQADRLLEAAA
jgi:hypothetical protein